MAQEGEAELIRRQVFSYLTNQLGSEWPIFIAILPGWRPTRAQAVIDQKREEERTVPNRIFACLMAWQQECPREVTLQNILYALTYDGVNRTDLRETVEQLVAIAENNAD